MIDSEIMAFGRSVSVEAEPEREERPAPVETFLQSVEAASEREKSPPPVETDDHPDLLLLAHLARHPAVSEHKKSPPLVETDDHPDLHLLAHLGRRA